MLSLMKHAAAEHHWLTMEQYSTIIAITSSAPGPIAMNTALFIGYRAAGVPGAVVAVGSTTLPSILMVFTFIKLMASHKYRNIVHHTLTGIYPVITALIFYTGIRLGMDIHLFSFKNSFQLGIMVLSFVLLWKKHSPFFVILLAAGAGVMYHCL
ncbi:chromate transporter [Halobacillus salinarum]|uniref:Chromate transporter n=2 Tax=Halobacillus salinarum TaxID=2932257 RepID=A0ABY4EEH6_9BACI|nr:chromate transporter [Halobacillus salinarum]UOQ42878.1 chromate transporter [Halobacillus salinarum]